MAVQNAENGIVWGVYRAFNVTNGIVWGGYGAFNVTIRQSIYIYYCKKLNSLKHLVRTTVAGSHN